MGKTSEIQWTDATWNIAVGCSKVDEDCKFCYMYRQSLNKTRYDPAQVKKTKTVFDLPNRLHLQHSSIWHGRPLIFTSSLTDFFHEDIDSFRHEAWDIIRSHPEYIFQILTKRPDRIEENLPDDWGTGWENVWLGTSVGSDKSSERIMELCRLGGGKHKLFLSLEPLHGQVWLTQINHAGYLWNCLTGIPYCEEQEQFIPENRTYPVDWVIVGGESGNEQGKYRYRPCSLEWIKKIVADCNDAGVPVFVKQLGTYLAKELQLSDRHGGEMDEWPEGLQVREFPVASND